MSSPPAHVAAGGDFFKLVHRRCGDAEDQIANRLAPNVGPRADQAQLGRGNQDAALAAPVCFDRREDDVTPSPLPIESSGLPVAPPNHAAPPVAPRPGVRIKKNKRDFERTLRDAGFSRSEAKAITAAAYTVYAQRDADADGEEMAALRRLLATIKA